MRQGEEGRKGDLINRPSAASTIRSALIETPRTHLARLKMSRVRSFIIIWHKMIRRPSVTQAAPPLPAPGRRLRERCLLAVWGEAVRNVKETFSLADSFTLRMLMLFNEDTG